MKEGDLFLPSEGDPLDDPAPVRKPKAPSSGRAEPFVKVPLSWIAAAAKATKSPATLVLIELLYATWKVTIRSRPRG